MTKTIFVKVPEPKKGDGKKTVDEESRICPIHPNDNPNGGAMMLTPADGPLEVMDTPNIRRRIRSGDLELTTPKKSAKE